MGTVWWKEHFPKVCRGSRPHSKHLLKQTIALQPRKMQKEDKEERTREGWEERRAL